MQNLNQPLKAVGIPKKVLINEDDEEGYSDWLRGIVFFNFLFNFIILLFVNLGNVSRLASTLDNVSKITLIWGVIPAFCTVLLSYFVWRDGEFEERLRKLEKKQEKAT